jgi:hypothetical protein
MVGNLPSRQRYGSGSSWDGSASAVQPHIAIMLFREAILSVIAVSGCRDSGIEIAIAWLKSTSQLLFLIYDSEI